MGCEVYAMIDNDYAVLQRALINGRPVDMETPLGRTYSNLVHKILGVDDENRDTSRLTLWAKVRGLLRGTSKRLPSRLPRKIPPALTAGDGIQVTERKLAALIRD